MALSGLTLISRLTPLKRILCVCPVPTHSTDDFDRYDIGLAVSDPYLSFASPITDTGNGKKQSQPLSYELLISRKLNENGNDIQCSLPKTAKRFINNIDYRDIGAVTLALPILKREENSYDISKLMLARQSIHCVLNTYETDDSSFSMLCYIDDRLTMKDVINMANQEPQMWEDVNMDNFEKTEARKSSIHAFVALNGFLLRHTGGWTNNTFG